MSERPQTEAEIRAANNAMAARILAMPAQPYQDGSYTLRVVEIRGRKSGEPIRLPIAVVQMEGERYLVSPTRQRSWAKNLLAARSLTVMAGGLTEQYSAEIASPAKAVLVLRFYVGQLTFAAPQFPFALSDSDDQIAAQLDKMAVFHLVREDV